MKKKFSSLLLTGKVTSLLLLMQQADAGMASAYQGALAQLDAPAATAVVLDTQESPPAPDLSAPRPAGGGATVCTDNGLPGTISLVLTGLQDGDTLMVLTSTSVGRDFAALDPRILIGSLNLMIPVSTVISAPAGARITMTFPLSLPELQQHGYELGKGKQFYLQSIVFPAGIAIGNWAGARISELDTITLTTCSTYGGGGIY